MLTTLLLTTKVAEAATLNCGVWNVISTPNIGSSYLNGVAAISAKNVWAAGAQSSVYYQTLIEHWNGTKWHVGL